jgi:hypothetical protein
MLDERLITFARRHVLKRPRVSAGMLCREALVIFSKENDLEAPELGRLFGETSFLEHVGNQKLLGNTKLSQYGVWFFVDPKMLEASLADLDADYIRPAMAWLKSSLPNKVEFALPSGFENPKGVESSAIERFDGIEMRCIIDKIPTDRSHTKQAGANVPATWIRRERWYNVHEDEFQADVPLAYAIRFDVRVLPTVT